MNLLLKLSFGNEIAFLFFKYLFLKVPQADEESFRWIRARMESLNSVSLQYYCIREADILVMKDELEQNKQLFVCIF